MKKLNGKAKKNVISVSAGVAAAAIVGGIVFGLRGRGEPVGVYPFTMVGMTEFWGDNQESYGPVTTDRIQTVFLSDTQTITEVLVNEGDEVKKGDVLMTYDTTLSELQLERKRLDVEKANLRVKEAQEELARINKLEPMGDGNADVPSVSTNYGDVPADSYRILTKEPKYDGSSAEKAMVCWVKDSTPINNELLLDLYFRAVDNQIKNESAVTSSASDIPEEGKETQPTVVETLPEKEETQPATEDTQPTTEDTQPTTEDTQPTTEDTQPATEETQSVNESETAPVKNTVIPYSEPEPVKPVIKSRHLLHSGITLTVEKGKAVNLAFYNTAPCDASWYLNPHTEGELEGKPSGKGFVVSGTPKEAGIINYTVKAVNGALEDEYKFTLVVKESVETPEEANTFYIVLEKTEGNLEKAPITMWQGMKVTVYKGDAYSFGFSFCDDVPSPDTFFPEDTEDISSPEYDFGSGMTAAEIAKLRKAQEKKIKELTASAKMTESEYNLMEREFNDGSIRATLDGQVVSLISEEKSRQNKQPMIKVSGGGGFYVQGSVSELEKDNLKVGQEVSINDWNTGMMYTGTVESIGDFPTQDDGWNGMGNPNASYYPFRVFIDGSADLREGSYVSVTYSAAEAENGVYLENPFLRTDEGESYVYVRGKNGKLEKRAVTTGKSLWGSYTEIRSGLTADDYVAFPYGKNVKPGAATEESDLSALYGY